MNTEEKETEYLFAYGTLQDEAVQLATFGRKLTGKQNSLVGYRLNMMEIADKDFAASSGTRHHRNLQFTGNASDFVTGTVYLLTQSELEQADAYEPDDYLRVMVKLKTGINAWVYVSKHQ